MSELTQELLKERLEYNPETGIFIRKITTSKRSKAGEVAGCNCNGYIIITINSDMYYSHRLAWLYVYGEWPINLDHKDQDRSNNRINNLREATIAENGKNRSKNKNNKSGCTGVSWIKRDKKWMAGIKVGNRSLNLGLFKDKFEAICARMSANNKYDFHENHGNEAMNRA